MQVTSEKIVNANSGKDKLADDNWGFDDKK
jgi:hypothetical protein